MSSSSSISTSLRAPLIWIVIPWVCGVVLASNVPRLGMLAYVLILILVVFAFFALRGVGFRRTLWSISFCGALTMVSIGIQQSRLRTESIDPTHNFPARELNLEVLVEDVVQSVPIEEEDVVSFDAVFRNGDSATFPATERVTFRCYLRKPSGMAICAESVLRTRGAMYFYPDRIKTPFVYRNGVVLEVIENGSDSFHLKKTDIHSKIGEILELGKSEAARDYSGIVKSILLGEKRYLTRGDKKLFQSVGIMHFLAISGFHLSAIAWMIYAGCKFAGIVSSRAKLVTVILSYCYVWLVGFPVSAQRAWIMLLFFFSAQIFRRKSDLLALVVAAALGIVLWNPDELFELGFQLSFGVVLGIVCYALPLRKRLLKLRSDDEFVPAEIAEGNVFLVIRKKLWFYAVSSFAVSWAAFWVSLPLVFGSFGSVPFVAVLLNPILAPLFVTILLSGGLSVSSGLIGIPLVSCWINKLTWMCLSLIVGVSKCASYLPLNYVGEEGNPVFGKASFVVMLVVLLVVDFHVARKRLFLVIPFLGTASVVGQLLFK